MKRFNHFLKYAFFTLFFATSVMAQPESLTAQLQKCADNYLRDYKDEEQISAVSLSAFSTQSKGVISVYSGTTKQNGKIPVDASNLFQIGSITKSFISVILLQLEADPKNHFSIEDPLKKYLPQYPKWGDVTVKQLLNMTSGIPSYNEVIKFGEDFASNPMKKWLPEELVAYAYNESMRKDSVGFHYSNTNYILAGMIITQLTGHSVEEEMQQRFLGQNNLSRLNLQNTFYITHLYPSAVAPRLVHGYVEGDSIFPVDTDITDFSLSWAGAAGANVASTEDITKWVKALFTTGEVLPPAQLKELKSLVSATTGKPIKAPTEDDPEAYGLGIAVSYDQANKNELRYYYEGGTLGYRAFYLYVPAQNIIVSVAVNSAVDDDNLKEIVTNAYNIMRNKSSTEKFNFKNSSSLKIKK